MNKLFLILFISLATSGCLSNEEFSSMQTKIGIIEQRLGNLEGKVDLVESKCAQSTADKNLSKYEDGKLSDASVRTGNLAAEDIQSALKNAGFYDGDIDGKIGPLTEKAIKECQEANGLKPDGVVGQMTQKILLKHLTEPSD
ncbi:MAG: peptidoglycan-binding domain-containing protein [Candidatus Omnitrophota bacterium]